MEIKLYKPTEPQKDFHRLVHSDAPFISCLVAGRQTGKAISVNETIYTADGKTTVGDVKLFDKIYGADGRLTTVTGIYEHPDKEVWEVEFEDGTIIQSCADHLWGVYHKKRGYEVKRTEDIAHNYKYEKNYKGRIKREFLYRVQLTGAVEYPEAILPIEPYTLGALIGDGSLTSSSVSITSIDNEILDEISKHYTVTKRKDAIQFGVLGLSNQIKSLSLNTTSHYKFLPELYKTASINQRLALLQGLMDTDGSAAGSYAEFYSVSEQLANDVADLARSLGMYASVKVKKGRYKGEEHLSFRVMIRYNGTQLFRLKRKSDIMAPNSSYNTHLYKRIVRVEKVPYRADMRCFTVDNESRLFLTSNYTVTHNTFFMQNDAVLRALNNAKHRIFLVSPIQDQANKVMKDIEGMFSNHQDVWNKIIKRYDRKANEMYFYNGSFIKFRSADSGDNLRGATLDYIYLDEAAYMKLDFINEVLLPMVTRTNGRVCAASTFNGPNWFYDWYKEGQIEENWEQIKSIKRTYLDLNDPSVEKTVLGIKKSMTKAQFDQEFLCRPVSANALFSNIEDSVYRDEPPKDYERIYIGMDIGVAQDYTVLTAMTEDYKVVEIDRFNYKEEGMDYDEFKDRIKGFYLRHDKHLAAAYFEMNNNDLLFDDITDDDRFYKLIPFQTTAQSKPEIIRNLVKLFEDKNIKIPKNDDLTKELYDFKSKRNPITGNLQFSNTDGKHDDMVISLAIAAYCAKEEQDGGVTLFL